MGFFRRKKKAVVVSKTASQNLDIEIKIHTSTVDTLERLKPRVNKLITHYKKQLDSHTHVHASGITLQFAKGLTTYPDGFYAFADNLGLNIEPICGSSYGYQPEPSFVVKAKSK